MRLLLIRHAESTWNATNRWQGQSDVPLTPRGRLQVRAVARRLYGLQVDARICSDLGRAKETAAGLGEPARPDPRFREIDVGEWAGLKRSEVATRFPEQVRGLQAGLPVRIGGGESMPEFEARIDVAVEELRRPYAGRPVLLVTHGGVIRALTTRILDVRGRPSPLVGVGNTALSRVVDRGGRLRLQVYNDGQHLDPADQDSTLMRLPEPVTRAALVAADPEGRSDRRLADLLLSGLGIAQYFAMETARGSGLADDLLADPLGEDEPYAALRRLAREHEMGAFGLLATPERVRRLVAQALSLSGEGAQGLDRPAHGSVTQLRITPSSTVLHSFGVCLDRAGL